MLLPERAGGTVVHYTDASVFGGAEQMIGNLLGALDRKRWRPVLLHHGEAGLRDLTESCRRMDVPVVEVPRHGARRAIGRYLRQTRAEIFHAHLNWPLATTEGIVGAAFARTPAVIATQHLFVPIGSRVRILRHMLISMAVDRYIAVSHHTAKMLREVCVFGDRKVHVVHNGIPAGPFEQAARGGLSDPFRRRGGRPVVLTVARLVPQKGIGHLIEAASLVREAFFAVAGDGPDRAALEAKVQASGVSDSVALLGHRRDVPELLAACEVFVLPSLYEGLPVSVLEAFASAKPVVATNVGGTDEAVKDGSSGLLVPPADPAALAGAIRRLLADADLSRRLATEAREQFRREFSVEVMTSRTIEIYEALSASRRDSPSSSGSVARRAD
jgi:glycosyltransferase involved in cell wall biosynthesis